MDFELDQNRRSNSDTDFDLMSTIRFATPNCISLVIRCNGSDGKVQSKKQQLESRFGSYKIPATYLLHCFANSNGIHSWSWLNWIFEKYSNYLHQKRRQELEQPKFVINCNKKCNKWLKMHSKGVRVLALNLKCQLSFSGAPN